MGELPHLFGVANLVRGDHLKPGIGVEHAKKRMRPIVGREVARGCFFEERKGSFANTTKSGEHGFLGGEEIGVERDRRLAADDTRFHHFEGEVKAFEQGNGTRRVADNAVGGADDPAFDLAEVGNDFGSGPAAVGWAGLPEVGKNGIGGAKEALLSEGEPLGDLGEVGLGHVGG